MATLTAREIIKREYGSSKNFVTPYPVKYGKLNKTTAYEISRGTGMNHEPIYGVSIVTYDPETDTTKREYTRSFTCRTLETAIGQIELLKA